MAHDKSIPPAARHFDELPDSALVDQKTVEVLEGVSGATIWRRIGKGQFPAPEPKAPGTRATRWRVGTLRKARDSYTHEAPK